MICPNTGQECQVVEGYVQAARFFSDRPDGVDGEALGRLGAFCASQQELNELAQAKGLEMGVECPVVVSAIIEEALQNA